MADRNLGWVKFDRLYLEHLAEGRLSLQEFGLLAVILLLTRMCTDQWTGSAASLVSYCGNMPRRTIQHTLQRLKKKKYIEYPYQRGNRQRYKITVRNLINQQPTQTLTGVSDEDDKSPNQAERKTHQASPVTPRRLDSAASPDAIRIARHIADREQKSQHADLGNQASAISEAMSAHPDYSSDELLSAFDHAWTNDKWLRTEARNKTAAFLKYVDDHVSRWRRTSQPAITTDEALNPTPAHPLFPNGYATQLPPLKETANVR